MQVSWQELQQHYQSLSLRERVMIAVAVLVAIGVLWYVMLIGPMLSETQSSQHQLAKLQATLSSLQQQQQALVQKQQQDPLRELKDRIVQLNQHLAQVDGQLKTKLHGLIAPQQMAKVLESVLEQHHDLKLIKLQSLPATPLVMRDKSADVKNDQHAQPAKKTTEVYRHGLQLQFEGSYLATLAYLKSLQALPWEFYWDEVRLEVENYPNAKVTIVVHTLSLTEGWIGV
jgi:MSHA biogenesis protein MshJ